MLLPTFLNFLKQDKYRNCFVLKQYILPLINLLSLLVSALWKGIQNYNRPYFTILHNNQYHHKNENSYSYKHFKACNDFLRIIFLVSVCIIVHNHRIKIKSSSHHNWDWLHWSTQTSASYRYKEFSWLLHHCLHVCCTQRNHLNIIVVVRTIQSILDHGCYKYSLG